MEYNKVLPEPTATNRIKWQKADRGLAGSQNGELRKCEDAESTNNGNVACTLALSTGRAQKNLRRI